MNIRSFRASDLSQLHEIDQACFPPGISYSRRELERFIRMARARTWVAEADGAIVGFVVANREPRGVLHVVTVDVVEAKRRSGIGAALMEAAENWAHEEGCGVVYLETGEDNLVAQAFYLARGYAKVDHIANYYSKGHAAWVMVKWLVNQPATKGRKEPKS